MSDLRDRLQNVVGDAYRIERELGGGGMSRLFLATEASLKRQVVIKLLPPEMASDISAARFEREVELAAHLQHPNILPVLASGARDDIAYYVMPYVAGESLRHRLAAEGRLPIDEARQILQEVADALAYAHAQGVVHRDIKPENILLQQGHAVLADFGVARAVAEARDGPGLTATGSSVGTPGYMAPEQLAGGAHVDARTDVYSLAVVGYEMLTGEAPFTGLSPQALLAAHLTQDAPPVRRLRPDAPERLEEAIGRALAKEPSERFATAAELRDAMKGAAPVGSRGWGVGVHGSVAGAAVLAVAATVAVIAWPRDYDVEGDPRRSIIVFPFANETGDASNDWLSEASVNLTSLGLAHWGELRVIDDERTASLLRRSGLETPDELDLDAALALAREVRVGTLLLGDVRREAEEWVVESKVHDVRSGDRIMTEIVRHRGDDPRAAFDSVVVRVLDLSGAPPGTRPDVVAQTTRSLEAYRQYLRGMNDLFAFRLDRADSAFAGATELDSTFALAYLRRANAEGWREGGNIEFRRALSANAERFGVSLPHRFRTLISAQVAHDNGQWARARTLAGQLLAQDPGDVEAWYQLGEAHFHDGPAAWPRTGERGDMGRALEAFERTLALDSTFVVAFRHIVDVLGQCSNPSASFVCLADSVAYGTPDDLEARLGSERVEALRRDAADRQVEVAYAWAAAVPGSPTVREELIRVLLQHGRYADADLEAVRLSAEGSEVVAGALRAEALLGQRRFREAGTEMTRLMGGASNEEIVAHFGAVIGAGVTLTAAGRLSEGLRVEQRVWDLWGVEQPQWPDVDERMVRFDKPVVRSLMDLGLIAQVSADSAALHRAAMATLDTLGAAFGADAEAHGRMIGRQSPFLVAYLASRDTSVLTRWLQESERTPWHSAQAHLALERGDTTEARRLLAEFFRPDEPIAPSASSVLPIPESAADDYGWANLLARLGEPERAVAAYDRLDRAPFDPAFWGLGNYWGLLVRSYRERGELYERLGDSTRAVEFYERFVDAWRDGDDAVRGQVEGAERAISRLRGAAGPD